ncbi:MAG: hypothetical protein DRJ38_07740 [Thermoprotei archaeon]|nr:MAG: hypothetical protein DRJ38_07740 [Thermoprotei archaeon]
MNIRQGIYWFFTLIGAISLVFLMQWFNFDLYKISFYALMITVFVLTVNSLVPREKPTLKDIVKVVVAIAIVLIVFIVASIGLIFLIT